MNKYFTYGLNIHSNVELPLWPAAGNGSGPEPEIAIERAESGPLCMEMPERGFEFHVSREGGELLSTHAGRIEVSPGRPVRIEARPLPEASEKLMAHFLSGSALALAIHYHGFLALHGCALRVHGKTVVFMATRGGGKSSLCAALCKLGHRIIADDISPIRWINERAHVMPGYPQLKLRRDIVEALEIPPAELTELHEIHPKVGWLRSEDRFDRPQPLDAIYFLGIGERELQSVSGVAAFGLLQRHSTPSQWGFEGGKEHFLACSRLIRETPVHAYVREAQLNGLMDQAKWISRSIQDNAA